jgi:hypothetical protein
MKCLNPNCNNKHDGSFGSGKFCSRACANSRIRTTETKQKISISMQRAKLEGRWKPNNFSPEKIKQIVEKRKQSQLDKLVNTDFSELKFEQLRKRILLEQDYKCNRCNLDKWLDEPLILELEHIDGNNQNNSRENLECLCPNCHSLTPTWRGRNKNKSSNKKVSSVKDEDIIKAFLETQNIRQTLIKLELAPKGANYGRVKRALTLWGIEYK